MSLSSTRGRAKEWRKTPASHADGEFVVEYEKHSEHLIPPYVEQDMTNLLVRLSRTNNVPSCTSTVTVNAA